MIARPFLRAAALLGLAACCPTPMPPAPAPHPTAAPVATPVASASRTPPSLQALTDSIVDSWLAAQPRWGREVGLHQYDGKVADYGAAAIARHVAWLTAARQKLAGVEGSTPDERLDRAILLGRIDLALFDLTERAEPKQSPRYYDELFDVGSYIDFDYAPLAVRVEKLVEHEQAALKQVGHIFANLDKVLSKPLVETSIKIYSGFADYLRGDVRKVVATCGDAALIARFEPVNVKLALAAEAVARRLKEEFLPRASDDKHVLGRERYLRFVKAQEGRELSLADLERMAGEDLARNKKAYEELLPKVKVTRPSADKLLAEATRMMDDSRRFIVDKKLVSIPSADRAVLKETPPYMRWNAAFLNMPGPFDTARQGFYYITLPDPSWPPKEQEEYIFPHGTLLSTTVHEVYPGHFLHGLWIRKAPTRVQKMTSSYSFTEGWAHYTEQLVIEQGFGAGDPQNRLGQLGDALLRNCRFVASIGMHVKGMGLDEVAELFEKQCFQDKATAREQAIRGTFDPGYFAYTLGKLQILALRQEAQEKLGAAFDLQKLHDAILSHGAPPVALIRDRVLADLAH